VSKLAALRRGRSLGAKISGAKCRPWGIFLVSTKVDKFGYPTVQTIPACDRRTDGRTDR